jgi:hypothetical protein
LTRTINTLRRRRLSRKFLRQAAILCFLSVFFPATIFAQNACDLNGDGVVNAVDVELAVRMTVGLATCTANVAGPGICTAVVVQRVTNASAPGATCLAHWVSLSWVASISPGVAGYNVYRSASPAGPFSKVNSTLISGLSFTDSAVRAGQTYYYVATAVDTNGAEGDFSDQAGVTVPSP